MKHHVFIIGSVWVEPNSSAAGSRMLQLMTSFLSKGWRITFGTVSHKNPNAIDLTKFGIEEVCLELNSSSFDEFITDLKPTIVVFDRFITEEQFGWRITENCPDALRILDTEDLHFLRKTRQQSISSSSGSANDFDLNDIAKREIASIYRSDLSLIISEAELKILIDKFKIDCSLLLYLPFMLDLNKNTEQKQHSLFSERTDFVSIGNFLHPPNSDVIFYLKNDIWPLIKSQLPQANLHVYGAYDTQAIRSMHNKKDGFLLHGYVEDAFEVVNSSRVLLAPLRFGAGLKGKLILAMQCGTPAAMSTIAAEGMFGSDQPNGIIEDDPSLFVKKCIDLYTQESLWTEYQNKGDAVLKSRFNKLDHQLKLKERISLIQSTIQSHRSDNFIGQLLAHHQFQSTKYMSRWIEVKNANLK